MNNSEKQFKMNSDYKQRQRLVKNLSNYDNGKIKNMILTDEINFELDDVSQLDDLDEKSVQNSSRMSFKTNSNTEGKILKNHFVLSEKNKKSIIVRNLGTETSIEDIEKLFSKFGLVNKVTMICDKYTGVYKGTSYIDFESENAKENSKELNQKFYKSKVIKVEDKTKEIPLHVGRKEKCYNVNMKQYFTSTKNNFGPIKIKKSLRKLYEPY